LLDAVCGEAVLWVFARGRVGASALLHSGRFLGVELAATQDISQMVVATLWWAMC